MVLLIDRTNERFDPILSYVKQSQLDFDSSAVALMVIKKIKRLYSNGTTVSIILKGEQEKWIRTHFSMFILLEKLMYA